MRNYLLLLLCYVLMLLVAGPFHECPLNDDWTYSASVKYLCDTGNYNSGNVPAMTLFAHVIWGSLFVKLFGFSFQVLTLSGIIAGFAGIIFTYRLFLMLFSNKNAALFAALLQVANPLYFSLCVTFMTDVPFYSLSVMSVFYYLRFSQNNRVLFLYMAILLSVAAVLIRQTGLVIPVSFSVWKLWENRKRPANWFSSISPVLFSVSALLVFLYWLRQKSHLSLSFQGVHDVASYFSDPLMVARKFVFRTVQALLLPGLFFLPLHFFSVMSVFKKESKKFRLFLLGLGLVSVFFLIRGSLSFPYGNIFNPNGLGPLTVIWGEGQKDAAFPGFPVAILIVLRVLAVCGALLLVLRLFLFLKNSFVHLRHSEIFENRFTFSIIIIFLVLAALPEFFFDRYVIFLFPFFLIPVFRKPAIVSLHKWHCAFSILFLVLLMSFSAVATRDYISRNETVWRACKVLERTGRAPLEINGGYEYNGWHKFEAKGIPEQDSVWVPLPGTYLVTFQGVENYKVVGEIMFRNYIPWQTKRVCLLRYEEK